MSSNDWSEHSLYNKVYQFVINSTTKFDASHNHLHAKEVYELSKQIMDKLVENDTLSDYDYSIIMMASLLHDVCDDKYVDKSITKAELHKFINEVDSVRASMIISIINNISYSKEVKGKLEVLPYPYNIYRDAISDADKICAIGEIGIIRCEQYTRESNPNITDDDAVCKLVVQHCHDKLLKLYTNNFIKTEPGRNIAEPHHQVIVDYVQRHESV